jgi:general secretion pathway protein N
MRARSIALLGAAAYAVFLVAGVPASFIAARVTQAAGDRANVFEAEGTVWHGSARARVIAPGGPLFIDSIEWRFLPERLAAGRAAFGVRASALGFEAQGEVGRAFSEWEAREVTGRAEGAFVAALSQMAGNLRPGGVMTVSAPALRWTDSTVNGSGTFEWKDAAVSLSEVRPLGTYRVEATGEGSVVKFTLASRDGPLQLSGRGDLTLPSRLSFSGEARAEGPQANLLDPLLDLVGPRRPDGARPLEVRMTVSRAGLSFGR